MGAYLQTGICYDLKVSKKDIENQKITFEEVTQSVSNSIAIDLYNPYETETYYGWNLKEEIFTSTIIEFLHQQYDLFNLDKESSEEILTRLKEISSFEEMIHLAEKKRFQNFQMSSIQNYIYCGFWEKRVRVEYNLTTYFIAGKIMMECYNEFLKYMESLIKKDNPYIISKAVKVLIQ